MQSYYLIDTTTVMTFLNNKKLIITPADYTNKKNYTFLVYDLEFKKLVIAKEKIPELDCTHLTNSKKLTFHPFGICITDPDIWIVSNDRLGIFDKKSYKFKQLIDVPLYSNTHQLCLSEKFLYVCNTAVDSIGVYNLTDKIYQHLSIKDYKIYKEIPTPIDARIFDTHHVNALFDHDNHVYFCLHNLGNTSEYGRFNKLTYKIDWLVSIGAQGHNIVINNNILYSLSSGTGELIAIDLISKKINTKLLVDSSKIYLRGLDIIDDHLVIGCSNLKERLIDNNCFILLLNINNGSTERFLEISHTNHIRDLKLFND